MDPSLGSGPAFERFGEWELGENEERRGEKFMMLFDLGFLLLRLLACCDVMCEVIYCDFMGAIIY